MDSRFCGNTNTMLLVMLRQTTEAEHTRGRVLRNSNKSDQHVWPPLMRTSKSLPGFCKYGPKTGQPFLWPALYFKRVMLTIRSNPCHFWGTPGHLTAKLRHLRSQYRTKTPRTLPSPSPMNILSNPTASPLCIYPEPEARRAVLL